MADEFLPKSYFASSLSMLSTIFLNAELISSLEFDDFLFCAESKFIQPKKKLLKPLLERRALSSDINRLFLDLGKEF